jgi:glycosyltransferase involved in cell wall biosynthesis
MTVLHVIPSLSPRHGGPSVALPVIARALVRQGIAVTIATTDDHGAGETFATELGAYIADSHGVRSIYFHRNTGFYKFSWGLTQWLRRHVNEFDLVHIHALFSYSSVAAARLAHRARVPYIVRPLGVLNRWGLVNRRRLLKQASLRYIELPILRQAAAIHFTSESERREAALADPAIGTLPSTVLSLPINAEAVRNGDVRLFHERFPEARGREVVLFLSRIDQKKGIELLLHAFRTVQSEFPKALLVVAGSGEAGYLSSLRVLAEKLQVSRHVLWAGFLSGADKAAVLAAATLFVLPSYSENFGIAAAESLAAGVPTILTEGVALADEVAAARAGIVVPAEPEAIASAIRKLLSEPDTREAFGLKGKALADDRFSENRCGRALKELYESVVKGS